MRNFRTAALAAATAATAATVAIGGAATATAETPAPATQISEPGQHKTDGPVVFVGEITKADDNKDKPFSSVVQDGFNGLSSGQGSSRFFNDTDKLFYGVDAFGTQTNAGNVPQWARYWIDGIVIASITTVVGLAIAGVNWASHNGLLNF